MNLIGLTNKKERDRKNVGLDSAICSYWHIFNRFITFLDRVYGVLTGFI